MFGRHVEKERIINFLLHDGSGEVDVLPIVGGMGVGKTTLAQHVCDDERVRGHFPVMMYSSFLYTLAMARGEPTLVLESKQALGNARNFIDSVHVLKENYLTKRFLMVFEDMDMRKKPLLEELLTYDPTATWKTGKQDHNHHQQQGCHEHGDGATDQAECHAASGVLVLLQGARVPRQRHRGGPKDGGDRQGDREEAKRVLLRRQDRGSGAKSPS